jgi:hypothetical protein
MMAKKWIGGTFYANVFLTLAVAATLCGAENEATRGAARGEGGFLSPREIDEMLADLDASPLPEGCAWGFVDFIAKRWESFDYVCSTCGTRTHYPELMRHPRWGDGFASFLTNLHQTVEFLRSKRLDVRVDERILCQSCRVALKIPDGGEIVALPTRWPPNRYFFSPQHDAFRTNFPFRIGDKLRILSEPKRWGEPVYCAVKENASYWIVAKDVSPEGRITARGTDSWVRFGPGDTFPSIGFLNRWCDLDSGVPLPETVTNGWMRLKVADDRCYAYYVPTGCVGRLTSSGAVLGRCDLLEHLKWTINGRETNIESDDCILLRTFFSGQRKIPGRSTNAALKQNRARLGVLLSSNLLSEMPDVTVDFDDVVHPPSWTNGDITVESDL